MELVKRFIIISIALGFLVSCAPVQFVPREMKTVKFQATPEYKLNADEIIIPDKPIKVLLDSNGQKTDDLTKVKYIAFMPEEYKKVQAFLKAGKAFKDISIEQEKLVNAYIREINALKEYVALQQLKAEEYRQLWADSENAYRQERHDHKIDNFFHRSVLGVITIGSIILCILAL